MPERIQLRRTKGWRLPPAAVSVARPTRWGNPYRLDGPTPPVVHDLGPICDTIEKVVESYRIYTHLHFVPVKPEAKPYRGIYTHGVESLAAHARRHLDGHDLACWCPLDQPCHADVLLAISNPGNMSRAPEGTERWTCPAGCPYRPGRSTVLHTDRGTATCTTCGTDWVYRARPGHLALNLTNPAAEVGA